MSSAPPERTARAGTSGAPPDTVRTDGDTRPDTCGTVRAQRAPDGLTSTDTVRTDCPDTTGTAWTLTPGHTTPEPAAAADPDEAAASERLALARQVLANDGYFTEAEIGTDLAPRLGEWLAHHRGLNDRAQDENTALLTRVHELQGVLAEVLSHFTVKADTGAAVRTGYLDPRVIDRWRSIQTGQGQADWTFPHVQGRCPACTRPGLFLGSGGYVTCSHANCTGPDAATALLNEADTLSRAQQRTARSAEAYDNLRRDVSAAEKYIARQRRRSPFRGNGADSRTRVLTTLTAWVKDPGPLTPPHRCGQW